MDTENIHMRLPDPGEKSFIDNNYLENNVENNQLAAEQTENSSALSNTVDGQEEASSELDATL